MLTQPRYSIHSQVGGITIYKRNPGTGTSGGMWLCRSVAFRSLARAREYAKFDLQYATNTKQTNK